jgi:hypothetical protein
MPNVIVFGEQHLHRVLRSYQQYYNGTRTHLSLGKDSPVPRAVHATGSIIPLPILGGLHHHYVRICLRHGQVIFCALGPQIGPQNEQLSRS